MEPDDSISRAMRSIEAKEVPGTVRPRSLKVVPCAERPTSRAESSSRARSGSPRPEEAVPWSLRQLLDLVLCKRVDPPCPGGTILLGRATTQKNRKPWFLAQVAPAEAFQSGHFSNLREDAKLGGKTKTHNFHTQEAKIKTLVI
jgi:hypothetical protein